ncbi:DUF2934 domain-containing protein [Rhizobium tubonense]|uniref:DUF2934 domain-containing protein n=1 Tax=Rhizobium tubonense TaxID=484088 RepID=A0A2W4D2G5_9HYPH|nr:DUF2934 domain-containing protein [Rhizobium tubonense]PZM16445.1 hypothetical protein CPY51_03660 [Rhizobium tubonense]
MDTGKTRLRAYEKWEAEGKPEGEHDPWREAEQEADGDGDLPQTSSLAHHSGTTRLKKKSSNTRSDVVPSKGNKPGSLKPGELASEKK